MATQHPVSPLTKAAVFLVLTVPPGSESAVKDVLAEMSSISRAVGFRSYKRELVSTVGIGSDLWDRMIAGPKPKNLHPLPEFRGAKHTAVSTPGDLLVHLRAGRIDLCFEVARILLDKLGDDAQIVDEVHGFSYFDARDLLGFVDGTENPEGLEAIAAALVHADDDPDFAGGSYVVVQKYVHDLKAWTSLSVEEQGRVIGRHKLDDVELPDDIKPSNSHVALNTIYDANGVQRQILRANMPFGSFSGHDLGTYFIGYAADPDVTETMLRHMFIGNPEGNYDRILDFSTAMTGGLFYTPTVGFLDAIADLPTPEASCASPDDRADDHADAAEGGTTSSSASADGSLGIGSLRH